MKGRHFSSDMEVIAAAETWLDGQHSDSFLVACESYSNGISRVLRFVGIILKKIRSLVTVACFLPCRAKDLSAPHRNSGFVSFL